MFDVFSIKEFSFPKDFLWGSATAAHQIEGDNFNSSHWAQEQENLKNNPSFEISGKAINHYEMFLQDADLLKSLHHKAYRMGVEWAKIEPEEGVFCQEVIDHYVKELSYLKELGITVLLTLVHFSTPLWFKNKGNFSNIDNLKYFESYLNKVVPLFSQHVDYWCVMNEQNLMDDLTKFNSVRFHARGYSIIKKYSSAPVSSAHALEWIYAKRQNDKFDKIYADFYDLKHNEYFFHAIRTGELIMEGIDAIYDKEIKNSCDYWAPNMYVRRMIDSRQANWHGRVERYPFVKMRMIDMDFYL